MNLATKRSIIEYAALAPSSHNTQPWKFKLTAAGIELAANYSRSLSAGDPSGRMLFLSLGAVAQNIRLAAQNFGLKTHILVSPNSVGTSSENIARISFSDAHEADAGSMQLFDAIRKRVSYRGQYVQESVSNELIRELHTHLKTPCVRAFTIREEVDRLKFADLAAQAVFAKMSDPRFRKELSSWLRTNYSKRRDGMHGFTHELGMAASILAPHVLRHFNVARKEKRKALNRVRNFPATVVLTTDSDSRVEWFDCGMALQRGLLFLASRGYLASIMAAPVEDETTRRHLFSVFHFPTNYLPQITFGFGVPTHRPRSSTRRPIEDFLV